MYVCMCVHKYVCVGVCVCLCAFVSLCVYAVCASTARMSLP